MTNYRDALTGQWTTAANAALRPAETVAEAVPARHETPDEAKLRRLAEACPKPGSDPHILGPWWDAGDLARTPVDVPADREFIMAASPAAVLALLDDADALRAELAHIRESRAEAPDVAELRRRLDALPGFTLKHLHGGPGGESYIALGDEGGMPLSDSGFDAVLFFAEIAALEVPRLLDRLAHMTEARDAPRAEVGWLRQCGIAGRCMSDITHRDEEHRQSFCMLPAEHAPLAHDDCMGCTWTDADHWQPSAVDRLADELHAMTALVAEVRATAEHYAGIAPARAVAPILRILDGGPES